ncbi:MAG TPA: ion transporter [Dyella sp.]|uniref:ion transporter n=1 Tax=Dyella sp. TaxID=1869338 RepID=UPI002CFF2611|nr:ion transporter [Dyella sp.]HTV85249.1 ion transporter [Dyella sp.]
MPTRAPSADELGPAAQAGWRARWFHIIFGHDDASGRRFDVLLIAAILGSIVVAVLDTVADIHARYGAIFYALEWLFTLVFTLEYVTRIMVVDRPWRYVRSFYGVVDVLAVLPTWISLVAAGSQYLLVVRALRILRIFRILKLTRYVGEADLLWLTLIRARRKVLIFFSTILTLVLIFGALMYLIEGPQDGFTSIPTSMYWAIVTMTTVGFGDITPKTTLGKLLTSLIILIGYSIIAVPTGIFTAELAAGMRARRKFATCTQCGLVEHDGDAVYCRICGTALPAGKA